MPSTCERADFLTGLAAIASRRTNTPHVDFRCGDLARLVGISPMDVLERTAHFAARCESPDELQPFLNYRGLLAWLQRPVNGNYAADVEIVFPRAGHQDVLAELLGIQGESCEACVRALTEGKENENCHGKAAKAETDSALRPAWGGEVNLGIRGTGAAVPRH